MGEKRSEDAKIISGHVETKIKKGYIMLGQGADPQFILWCVKARWAHHLRCHRC